MVLYVAQLHTTYHPRLANFETLDQCTDKAIELTIDMMDAYPGDDDTWFTCKLEHV